MLQPDASLRRLAGATTRSARGLPHRPTGTPCRDRCHVPSPSTCIQKEAYRRNGVQEYIVWRVDDQGIDWFGLHEGDLRVEPDGSGIIETSLFPGLRLDVDAMLSETRPR